MADPNVQDVVDQIDKDPAQPAVAPEPTASARRTDPDDAELAAAQAAVDAEEKGESAQPAAAAPAAQPAAPQPQAAAPAAAQPPAQPSAPAQEPIMVPKARLDEVLAKQRDQDMTIARLQGENEALKLTGGKPATGQPAQPQPQAETFDQKVDRIYAAKEDLAKKFDNGEMSLVEMRREERKLDVELDQAREARLNDRIKAQAPPQQQQPASNQPTLALERELEAVEAKHPYLQAPEVMRDDRWQFLLTEADGQLRAEGVDLPPPGQPLTEKQRIIFGERVGVLSDTYGPIWGAKAPQPKAPQPPAPQPKPAVVVARENKLAQAANAPPDINRLTPQGGQTEFTEDMIASMSDDEILALPPAVRNRYLNS